MMVLQCALQVWTFTAALLWRGVTSEEWGQTGTLSLASLMTHETIYTLSGLGLLMAQRLAFQDARTRQHQAPWYVV